MEIIKIESRDAWIANKIIKKSFSPLLDKYQDGDYNPATKTLERLIAEINHPTSETYLLKFEEDYIGYARINKRNEKEYSISDLCIDPEYQ